MADFSISSQLVRLSGPGSFIVEGCAFDPALRDGGAAWT